MKFELKPYNQNVPDKELLDDLIKVAKELMKDTLISREYDEKGRGRFHSTTIANRFGGWNNALDKAGLKITKQKNISDEELLNDLFKVANGREKLSISEYNAKGKYTAQTMNDRFGSWNKAIKKANLKITNQQNISEIELFKNLEDVWIKLGSQPGRREMIRPVSKYSERPYLNKFGTWRKALEAFVAYINSDIEETENIECETDKPDLGQEKVTGFKHKTKRDPNNRLKLKVMWRDGNICRLCGIKLSVWEEGHFDHIIPWSKEGETVLENLQILCAKCNFTKGNYDGEV